MDTRAIYLKVFRDNLNPELRDRPVKMLDVGAGNCWYSNLIDLKGAEKYAIDLHEHQHFDNNEIEMFMSNDKCHFQFADATNIPFPDETFDIVFSNEFISHVCDIDRAIAEQIRVLKGGGNLFIIDSNPWCPHLVYSCFIKNYLTSRNGQIKRGGLRWLLHRDEPFYELAPTKSGCKEVYWKDENIHSNRWWKKKLSKFSQDIDYRVFNFWSFTHSTVARPISNKTMVRAIKR